MPTDPAASDEDGVDRAPEPTGPPPPLMPPYLDEVRRLLRGRISELPGIIAEWPLGRGPLADVPLLDPGFVAPKVFDSLSGTVRVASVSPELVTVAGLLEVPTGGLLVTVVTVSPADLTVPPDEAGSRRVLAAAGATSEHLPVEVVALLSALDADGGGPAAGVGIVRPLVLADPTGFPRAEDPVDYPADLRGAVAAAVADDREVVADLAGSPLHALPDALARIWAPMFAVARAATVGLAARGVGMTVGEASGG